MNLDIHKIAEEKNVKLLVSDEFVVKKSDSSIKTIKIQVKVNFF